MSNLIISPQVAPDWMPAFGRPSEMMAALLDARGPHVAYCQRRTSRQTNTYFDNIKKEHFGSDGPLAWWFAGSERREFGDSLKLPMPGTGSQTDMEWESAGWLKKNPGPTEGSRGFTRLLDIFLPAGYGRTAATSQIVRDWQEVAGAAQHDSIGFLLRAQWDDKPVEDLHFDRVKYALLMSLTSHDTTLHAAPGSWTNRNCFLRDVRDLTRVELTSAIRRQLGASPVRSFCGWGGARSHKPQPHTAQSAKGKLKIICIGDLS